MTKKRQTITFEYESEDDDVERFYSEGARIKPAWDNSRSDKLHYLVVDAQPSVRVETPFDIAYGRERGLFRLPSSGYEYRFVIDKVSEKVYVTRTGAAARSGAIYTHDLASVQRHFDRGEWVLVK
jgi:hypothetical protein